MSVSVLNWAMAQRAGGAVPKSLLIVLANLADDRGRAWPSTKALAEMSEANLKSVKSGLARLIDMGLIEDTGERVGLTGHVRVLRLRLTDKSATSERTQKRDRSTGRERTQKRDRLDEQTDPKTTIKRTQKRVPDTKGHEKNNSGDLFGAQKSAPKCCAEIALPEWLPLDAWADFLAMRAEQKNKATPVSQTRLIAKLKKLRAEGHDPREVIDASIERGWRSFYPLKSQVPANAGGTLSDIVNHWR